MLWLMILFLKLPVIKCPSKKIIQVWGKVGAVEIGMSFLSGVIDESYKN